MMEIYNEQMERIENPDLALGWLKPSARTEHHAAVEGVEEVWHYETVVQYPNGGRDVEKVIDIPGVEAQEAWDEEIPIQIYVPYTSEELAAIEEEKNKPTQDDRITVLEETITTLVGLEESTDPTQLDIIEAQVTYTAMMTDTLLEV